MSNTNNSPELLRVKAQRDELAIAASEYTRFILYGSNASRDYSPYDRLRDAITNATDDQMAHLRLPHAWALAPAPTETVHVQVLEQSETSATWIERPKL